MMNEILPIASPNHASSEPQAEDFSLHEAVLHYTRQAARMPAGIRIVWGHGWGQSGAAFMHMLPAFPQAEHIVIDFPGFGLSPRPLADWGVVDYADAMADFLTSHPFDGKTILIGHSFGGRVWVRLMEKYPHLADGIILIAGAGLPRKRSLVDRIIIKRKIWVYKLMKKIALSTGQDLGKLRERYGSRDYRAAGEMRSILVKVLADDVTEQAKKIRCPVLLLYGEMDQETPPDVGESYARLIPQSSLTVLPGLDHYTILDAGRHIVQKKIADFIRTLT